MSNVKLHSLAPNVIVDNVNQAVDYYSNNLGFKLIVSVPETGQLNWAMIMRGGVTLMFQSLESIQEDLPTLNIKQKGSLGTFFIEMDGIDALYNDVKDKIKIASAMRTTFYGKREFTIEDLNGYFITFAEDVK
jgi:uncharacterized glyoxalase superfamily protein PhnB